MLLDAVGWVIYEEQDTRNREAHVKGPVLVPGEDC